jgi:hypothetical protein
VKITTVAQHAVQNTGQLTGHGYGGLPYADPFGEPSAQDLNVDHLATRCRMIPAASNKYVRSNLSPHREI